MKKDKKQIFSMVMSKTIMFIFVVLFVSVFQGVFGSTNSLIGVTTIVLTLVLLQRDLTIRPIKNLFQILVFNLVLGLGAFTASQNVWLGIIINFLILFVIGYVFSYQLRKPVNMLFGLHYILMLTSPVTIAQLPMRLLALVAGAFIIMAVQLVANRNKLNKANIKMINSIEDNILSKVDLFKKGKDTTEVNTEIENSINKFKLTIFDSGKKDFHMTNCGKYTINVISCLEKINTSLDEMGGREINPKVLKDIYIQLKNIRNDKFNSNDIEDIVEKFKNKGKSINLLSLYEVLTTIEILNEQKGQLKEIEIKHSNVVDKNKDIPDDFIGINVHKRNMNLKDFRVAYGIRLGLLVALTSFITNYFNIEFGNWAMYTVFGLTQPYAEYTIIKSKKRIIGTLIGSVIVFMLFNLIQDTGIRTLILVAGGYLMSYFTDYKYMVIFITMSAICPVALNEVSPNEFIINRIVFVIIGIGLALLANKFILPRKYKDEEIIINNMQKEVTKRVIEEVVEMEISDDNVISNLYIIPSLIESRLETQQLNVKKEEIKNNKILINNIHQIQIMYGKNIELMKKVKKLINNSSYANGAEQNIREYMKGTDDIREKAVLTLILRTLDNMYSFGEVIKEEIAI